VRQRVNARDGEAKVRIELVGDAKRVGLQSQPQEAAVPVVAESRIQDSEGTNVAVGESYLTELLRLCADKPHSPSAVATDPHNLYAHRLIEERADDDTTFA